MDDIITNTLGGLIGQSFYVLFAYVLTHPDFRKEWKQLRRWRSRSRNRAFYPFFSKIDVLRITLLASDKDEVFSFYEEKLGLRLKKLVFVDEKNSYYLFEIGKNQIEIHCSPDFKDIHDQNVTIACNNSEYLKKNLEKHGIATGDYQTDPYTGLRIFSFIGPDRTSITIIEE